MRHSFHDRAKKASRAIRDVKRTPTQEAADWVEYGMNNEGAMFNQVAAVHLSWIERSMIDVYGFLGAIVFALLYVGRVVLSGLTRSVLHRLQGKGKAKTQ